MTKEQMEKTWEAAAWYMELRETSNKGFLPLYFDEHRYLVLKGGGGSGKSIFAGRKILERVTTEPGHRWLVCRKVAKTIRESCFKQLIGQLAEHFPESGYRVNKGDMSISFPNGSEIITAGLDDVEKLKSIYNITGVWIEEASEILESDFNQLDIRLRGETRNYKQIILSFNPISVNHWLKRRFFDFDIKDPEVRAETIANTRTHESTYKDNRFLPAEDVRTLERFKGTDEYYYQVYCLGMWGVTGRTVFDARALTERLRELAPPKQTGLVEFEDNGLSIREIRWAEEKEGCVRVYLPPEPGAPYVIGADTAGEGSDSFVAQVLDNRTGEQAAVLRGQFDEDVFARQLYCLGMYYNQALIGVETNFSTYTVLELERLKYPRQYVRQSVDTFTHEIKSSYGFRTDSKTRPVIIAELIKIVREHPGVVNDETTIQEMLTFVRNPETLRPEAEAGAHDDCVLSLAIAHFIRPQQEYLKAAAQEQGVRWHESQWEDYERASPEEKEMLIKKWGKPS